MKKIILGLSIATYIATTLLTGCTYPEQKVENAQEDVKEANENLEKANKEYLEDIEKYRTDVNQRIAANDKIMADFKAKLEADKKIAKTDYNEKIAELEQKNNAMKKKMAGYKTDEQDKWQSFKNEFNHDMDKLGEAFEDLTTKNVK
jgi:outer membrane murein-binding lipoprotein Lpp